MKTRYKITATCFDKRGYVLSRATNSYKKTHPLQAYFAAKVGHPERKFLHAEIYAILKAKGRSIHHLVVERFGANKEWLDAKPCEVCMEAIKAFGIKYLTFSVSNFGYKTVEVK